MIEDVAHSGAFNMGVDEALLRSAIATGTPTLRFYQWDGPWLSLGYGQPSSEARLEACRSHGVGVVRRLTGGRAVLHGNDLTYAIAAPESLLPEGLQGSYRSIGAALLAALRSLGLDVTQVVAPLRSQRNPVGFDCFETPAAGEICVGDRKLAGHAQRRSGGAVLQHGSIRLQPDAPAQASAAGQRPGTAISVAEAGISPDSGRLAAAIQHALEVGLGAAFERCELDRACLRGGEERERAHARDPLAAQPIPRGEAQEALFGSR